MKNTAVFKHIREICLAFPDAVETDTWDKPHFRVNNKIFAGCGEEDGKIILGFKLGMDHAKEAIRTPGFWKAPYVGHKGWVSMDASDVSDWTFVREMVEESYKLIAPKRSLDRLSGSGRAQKDGLPSTEANRPKKIRKKK